METIWYDLRHAVRALRRQPGFTLVALLTLTLGIGANTAIFSLVHAVLLRPLPYPDSARLVRVWGSASERGRAAEQIPVSFPRWEMLCQQQDVFAELAASRGAVFTLTGRGEPVPVFGSHVSARFFQTLAVRPAQGRLFLPEEDRPGAPRVVIVSAAFWRKHFPANPPLLGQTLNLDGASHAIVGVLAAPLSDPYQAAELFVPGVADLPGVPPAALRQGAAVLYVTARLKPGVGIERAAEAMRRLAVRYRQVFPDHADSGYGLKTLSIQEEIAGPARPMLLTLAGAVAGVLLIACVNVANLLLARLAGRQGEIAVREVLGANPLRLARQFLTESLLLTLSAAALGSLLAWWGVHLARGLGPEVIPRAAEIRLSETTLFFTLGLSLVTGGLLGIVPALSALRRDPGTALQRTSTRASTADPRQGHMRAALLVAQVAFSLVLLTGTGLLLTSLWQLQRVPLGFNPEGVVLGQVSLPAGKYPRPEQQSEFFARLIERTDALPGVRRSAVADGGPLLGYGQIFYAVVGRPVPPVQQRPNANCCFVSPGFFAALGIPLLRGRTFTTQDRTGQPPVMMINETMAKQLFPDGDALGQRLLCTTTNPTVTEIVGVVGDARTVSPAEPALPEMYFSMFQRTSPFMFFWVQAGSPAGAKGLIPTLGAVVRTLDPDLPLQHVEEMNTEVRGAVADRRLVAWLLTGFAGLGLILAAVGIYGVTAYGVARRTREIGVRLALGAQRGDVLRLIIGGGMRLVLVGLLVGVAGAFGLTRFVTTLLYGVGPTDPLTFAAVVVLLTVVALLASYLPARRAARLDPLTALRES